MAKPSPSAMEHQDRPPNHRSRSLSSSSSTAENTEAGSVTKRRKSKQLTKPSTYRSITCVECGEKPSLTETEAPCFDSWSEKYFHVADWHMFRRFECPYLPCKQMFRTLIEVNRHIEESHPGSRKRAEPPGYHEEIKRKVPVCFPIVDVNAEEKSKKKAKTKKCKDVQQSRKVSLGEDDSSVSSSTPAPVSRRMITRSLTNENAAIGDLSIQDPTQNSEQTEDTEISTTPVSVSSSNTVSTNEHVITIADNPPTPTAPATVIAHFDPNMLLADPSHHPKFPGYQHSANDEQAPVDPPIIPPVPESTRIEVIEIIDSEDDDEEEPFLIFPGFTDRKKKKRNEEPPTTIVISNSSTTNIDEMEEEPFLSFPV